MEKSESYKHDSMMVAIKIFVGRNKAFQLFPAEITWRVEWRC